jgi:DNA ligase (NAD+)
VTLHNFSFIKNKLININDEIIIEKAGDVVPQVVEVIKKKGNSDF